MRRRENGRARRIDFCGEVCGLTLMLRTKEIKVFGNEVVGRGSASNNRHRGIHNFLIMGSKRIIKNTATGSNGDIAQGSADSN